jgi:L-xylulokinase
MLPGQLCVVAGTWSINQIVSTEPIIDCRWACRNFVEPGRWMNMAASPASATNLEWFVERLCTFETLGATGRNSSPIAFVEEEVEAVLGGKTGVFYHPFLYGSPHGDEATAGFFGLRGWHNRGHLLRALIEGIVFNHRTHIDALREKFEVSEIRLAGGMARSGIWRQMFADVLGAPVLSTNFGEEGALGAALCAGVGVQTYDSLQEAANEVVRVTHVHEPDPERYAQLSEDYETYISLMEAMDRVWRNLD